ncbi:MAG TPA: hypothetical protein VKE22_11675 [Haliangiales bacterium]|nr:hypothetical protein [Haliangiales bacterium]
MARRYALLVVLALVGCGSSSINSSRADAPTGGTTIDAPPGSMYDAGADAPGLSSPCPPYQSFCGGRCIDTVTDPMNCGRCDNACTGSQVCSGGACTASCLPGLSPCGNRCVNLGTDNQNCGTCGHPCGPGEGCAGGSCVPAVILPPPAACQNGGPPIDVPVPGQPVCAGNLAQRTFRWALCSCRNVVASSLLTTDAFNSATGPYMPGGKGGAVGLNGSLTGSSGFNIGGTVWASAAAGVILSSDATIRQELHVGGQLTTARVMVGEDGFVVGNINGDALTFDGVLHLRPGATITGNVTYKSLVREAVTVPPPCDCTAEDIIPVAAIVAARRTSNDNASVGLDPALFTRGTAPARLDLPCGSYYLDAISISNPLTIVAHGNTALYIGGNVSASSAITFTLDPTAQFDVFIGGTMIASSGLTLGSPAYPASMRTYAGGAQPLDISSGAAIAGNFYDAAALLRWSAEVAAYGAVFAGDFNASADVTIHYDREVTEVGRICPPTPTMCTSCTDCNNQACINGTCGMCTDSSQCCPPLQCINGTCQVSQCPVYADPCAPGNVCPIGFACVMGCCLKYIP